MQQGNIIEPTENDILSAGRGNRANNHSGNLRYQSWVNELREDYAKCEDKSYKPCYAKAIMSPSQKFESTWKVSKVGRQDRTLERNGK